MRRILPRQKQEKKTELLNKAISPEVLFKDNMYCTVLFLFILAMFDLFKAIV